MSPALSESSRDHPAPLRATACATPFDPAAAIDAQAHLMHDLLRRLGSVPLALAAYNAGPAPVQACGCVPSSARRPGPTSPRSSASRRGAALPCANWHA
jgi:soluble lytic murein transglycosylase-like protein